MKVSDLDLSGLALIELQIYADKRGFFVARYEEACFSRHGLPHFCQDNHSRSAPGVLRGLHYQVQPPQGKLVGVVRGSIWDVVVDIRSSSPTYGRHLTTELNDRDGRLLWIPAGFAHGFWDLGISWPILHPIVSDKDQDFPGFSAYRENPAFR